MAFWVLFGGEQQTRANVTEFSEDLTHPHRVAVMLFRMLIVDDYPYDVIMMSQNYIIMYVLSIYLSIDSSVD